MVHQEVERTLLLLPLELGDVAQPEMLVLVDLLLRVDVAQLEHVVSDDRYLERVLRQQIVESADDLDEAVLVGLQQLQQEASEVLENDQSELA